MTDDDAGERARIAAECFAKAKAEREAEQFTPKSNASETRTSGIPTASGILAKTSLATSLPRSTPRPSSEPGARALSLPPGSLPGAVATPSRQPDRIIERSIKQDRAEQQEALDAMYRVKHLGEDGTEVKPGDHAKAIERMRRERPDLFSD